MAPILDSLENNSVYNYYFPCFYISLSILYVVSFLIRFAARKYRRIKEKKVSIEIQRLKQSWKECVNHGIMETTIPFPPSVYHDSLYSTTSTTVVAPSKSIASSHSSTSSHTLQSTKSIIQGKHAYKIDPSKRLSILWQWSVAMGYAEYEHAKHLNQFIDELSRGKSFGLVSEDLSSSVPLSEKPV